MHKAVPPLFRGRLGGGILASSNFLQHRRIGLVMAAGPVWLPRFGHPPSPWRNEAVNSPYRVFAPLQVEGGELGEEFHVGIGQMVMHPPGHGFPIASALVIG